MTRRLQSGLTIFGYRCLESVLDRQVVSPLDPFIDELLAGQLDPEDRVKEMQPWFHRERRIVLKDGRELTWTRPFRAAPSRD